MLLDPHTTDLVNAVQRTMQDWMPAFEADLAWLAGHDRGYHEKAGVDAAIAWMRDKLAALGCETRVFASETTGDTLAGTLRGMGQGRCLLIAHLDTVWPAGTAAGWPLRVEGRHASGPGVVDNGSGSLAGYYVLKALQNAGHADYEALTLVCNGDEESGSLFSGPVIQQLAAGCDAALCLEAPAAPDEFISARGGSMGVTLRVAGRRAHTQINHQQGANAILELAHKIIAAESLSDSTGEPAVCVVTSSGGPQSGTVPDTAEAQFDVRLKTMADAPQVEAGFAEIAARNWVPGTSTSLTTQIYHPPMERLPGTARLAALAQAIGASLGLALRETSNPGVSDACFATVAGVPTLCGLAPFGDAYHTRGEWLDLGTVPERVALAAGLVAAGRAAGAEA
jgi:glutamate carboxypeptidase